jgi:hypothetical protein
MAYFADLTDYSYGSAQFEEGSMPDLNVGWLEVGHPFPTAEPEREFVKSLIRCCRRPVRLYRGFHDCDLCDVHAYEMTRVSYEGRCVRVGNGEVRVDGPDGRWYTAPTLVAHYVMTHRYCPPEQFVSGVLRAATTIPCIDAEQFSQLHALSISQRFELCLDLLVRANETLAHPWVARAIKSLSTMRSTLVPTRWGKLRRWLMFESQLAAVNEALVLPRNSSDRPPRWTHDVARNAMWILMHARNPDAADETLEFTATAIECALEQERDFPDDKRKSMR